MNRQAKITMLTLTLLLVALLIITATVAQPVHAVGQPNYQVAQSGECNNKTYCGIIVDGTFVSITGLFINECTFGGGSGTAPTSGTTADCEMFIFFHPFVPGEPAVHLHVQATAWKIATSAETGQIDFLISAGTITSSGQLWAQLLGNPGVVAFLEAAGCTISGKTLSCSIATEEAIGIYPPDGDTGVPFIPGHSSSSFCFTPAFPSISAPGCHIEQQLTVIS